MDSWATTISASIKRVVHRDKNLTSRLGSPCRLLGFASLPAFPPERIQTSSDIRERDRGRTA
jgi:hypothetical protein